MTRSLAAPEAIPAAAAWQSALEDGLSACIRTSSLPLVTMATLATVQAEWAGRVTAALLDAWRLPVPNQGPADWRANHPMFELGFLLGRCGEERPFPSD